MVSIESFPLAFIFYGSRVLNPDREDTTGPQERIPHARELAAVGPAQTGEGLTPAGWGQSVPGVALLMVHRAKMSPTPIKPYTTARHNHYLTQAKA